MWGTFSPFFQKVIGVICKFCENELNGKQTKFCCRSCKGKYYRKENIEEYKKRWRQWYSNNIEYNKKRNKEYKSTEKYRLMKKTHDLTYRLKHGNKKNERNEIQQFRHSCRNYASRKMKKTVCSLCGNKETLELHHSKGYEKQNLRGVIVVCKPCHLEVIHGRGTRCQN